MNTNFAASAFDNAIALQRIRDYCEQHMKDIVNLDQYDRGVYDTCWDILEIINE